MRSSGVGASHMSAVLLHNVPFASKLNLRSSELVLQPTRDRDTLCRLDDNHDSQELLTLVRERNNASRRGPHVDIANPVLTRYTATAHPAHVRARRSMSP